MAWATWVAGLAWFLVGPLGAGAQPIGTFSNYDPNNGVLAPVYGPEPGNAYLEKHGNTSAGTPPGATLYGGALVQGSGYTAELWLGAGGVPENGLSLVARTNFLGGTLAGYYTFRMVPITPPGTTVTIQVRAYENRNGTVSSWNQVKADPAILRGTTLPYVATVTAGTIPPMPNALRSFNLHQDGTPYFTSQPTNQVVPCGSNVTFSAIAAGPTPLGYQWYKNGSTIAGATSPTLTLNAVRLPDSGSGYAAVANNAFGSATSQVATLTVFDSVPPTINCPSNITVTTRDPSGEVVRYVAVATEACDSSLQIYCLPPSGTNYPVGTTVVTCTAFDSSHNTNTCSFLITVNLNDQTPPQLVAARANCASNLVWVSFSEPMDPGTVLNVANYSITPNVNILGTMSGAPNLVGLKTAPMSASQTYALTVANVKDLAGNVLYPNPSTATFDCGLEVDYFSNTVATVQLQTPSGAVETVVLTGPTTIHVQVGLTGAATDTDQNGLDDAQSEIVQMELSGVSSFGPVTLRLRDASHHPYQRSLGRIEEKVNLFQGRLDLPPFSTVGSASSFFDIYFQIELPGLVLHNVQPKHMQTTLHHKPPGPGETYEAPETIYLVDESNQSSGFLVLPARHTPNPTNEVDTFYYSLAQLILKTPAGAQTTVEVAGPTVVQVAIPPDGTAQDSDRDGLDQAASQMTLLNLTGNSAWGPVTVRLNPARATLGEIEELVNNTPGKLDIPPFTPTGRANSFFDVYAQVQVGGQVLTMTNPIHMASVLSHKPPGPGELYSPPQPQTIALLGPNNTLVAWLIHTAHTPQPEPEIDVFTNTTAQIELMLPNGDTRNVTLTGPTVVRVNVPPDGTAADTDGNGRDQAPSEMVVLNLSGSDPVLGPITLRLRDPSQPPFQRSLGQIEELVNNTPGKLDVPPFTASGQAESFFNVYFEVQAGPYVFHNLEPKRMRTFLAHKPPEPGAIYQDSQVIYLYDEQGLFTGASLRNTAHTPNGDPPEIDFFTNTTAVLELALPNGATETVTLSGPTRVHVWVGPQGQCSDTDGNGLDEARSEIVLMELMGESSMGPVWMSLRDPTQHPFQRSLGRIEELANNTPGILDVAPFASSGQAESFFDVYFQVVVADRLLHNAVPKHMRTIISHKPPGPGETYEAPQVIDLLDEGNSPSGVRILRAAHTPTPPEIDYFQATVAAVELGLPNGQIEHVVLSGPTEVHVNVGPNGEATDPDGNGLDQASSEIVSMVLRGVSASLGPVTMRLRPASAAPFQRSLGRIEEQANAKPGRLDLPPFAASGAADSFFDVFFQIEAGGLVLHNLQPKRMRTTIHHKPPGAGETYQDPQVIELYDERGLPAGVRLLKTSHTPNPTIEIDTFYYSLAQMILRTPTGQQTVVDLAGPTVVQVAVPPDGAAQDTDQDGLDQAPTEMLMLNLTGNSAWGPVAVQLNPARRTLGEIEEVANNTPGTLDVPPFTAAGSANSFFDVFAQVVIGQQVLYLTNPIHMASVIKHKPPGPGESYTPQQPQTLALVDAKSNLVAWLIHTAHTPQPEPEYDYLSNTIAQLELALPNGLTETVTLSGPTLVRVDIPPTGQAADTDGNGLDQAPSEIVAMTLTGYSPMVGPVTMRLRDSSRAPFQRSLGRIEEVANNTPGKLDLPPFTSTGQAQSFFDVYFEVEAMGQLWHNTTPKHMRTFLSYKPPQPGATYEDPQAIDLFDEQGLPVGVRVLRTAHTANPPMPEIDFFPATAATLEIALPDGRTESVKLSGPTTVHVYVGPNGEATDNNSNGRDDVRSAMTQLDLKGTSSLGPMVVRLASGLPSPGLIEELANQTPGILDVPPFTPVGQALSFFDVNFEVLLGSQVFHTDGPVRMQALLTHKPPAVGESYTNLYLQPVPLLDAQGNPTGVRLIREVHTPNPPEIDSFSNSVAQLTLLLPNRTTEVVQMSGPTVVRVNIPPSGTASDTDGDGLDQVTTEMTQLDLQGVSSMGPVRVRLDASHRTVGMIEEQANNTPGVLDLPPFTATGSASSFFDIWAEVTFGGQVFYPARPLHMQSIITHKPPGLGEFYLNPFTDPVELLTSNGVPSGVYLIREVHTPNPTNEIDTFYYSLADVTIQLAAGQTLTVNLSGPTVVNVHIPPNGAASDTDGDGRDQVTTEMLMMNLQGLSPLGPVLIRLDPARPTVGELEERANFTPGILDVPPFSPVGSADSYFDVFAEVVVGGQVLRMAQPIHMAAVITHKPPQGEVYMPPQPQQISLLDSNNNVVGWLIHVGHTPQPPFEIDRFNLSQAQLVLQLPSGRTELVTLTGPTTVKVNIPPNGAASDTDANGLDQASTEMLQLNLLGPSSMGPVLVRLDPTRPTLGQIEEQANNTPGILDVPPFAAAGSANSFFDVFAEVAVAGMVFHTAEPLHLTAVLTHKPPGPGESYINPYTQPVALLTTNGEPTGLYLVREVHTPNPTNEIDTFDYSVANVQIRFVTGGQASVDLSGPTVVKVALPPTGATGDHNGNGLDDAASEMLLLNLQGNSPLGPVSMTLDPNRATLGQIEELANNTPGTLDVPPFTAAGQANSFFDVFAQLTVAGQTLHMTNPIHMASVISHKPPRPGDVYKPPQPQTVPLFNVNNQLVAWLTHAEHVPEPPREVDTFTLSQAELTLALPNGMAETVYLAGPTVVNVGITPAGLASDTDGNGLDQAPTEMVQLNLQGISSVGPVQVRLDPNHRSFGQIEEVANNTPGVLDVPPFTAAGRANSFFDVFAEVVIAGQVFQPRQPFHMQSVITHKPPAPGETYTNPYLQPIELMTTNGQPTGLFVLREVHTPDPTNELDLFSYSLAQVTVQLPDTVPFPVNLAGPTVVKVAIPPNGAASDHNGNGLDDTSTEMVLLNLQGNSPMGPVFLRLDPAQPSLGSLEELANNTPGTLDLPPFTPAGQASSSFKIYARLQVGGQMLTLGAPIVMNAIINHKPPGPGDLYTPQGGVQQIPLLTAQGQVAGWLIHAAHIPTPPIEIDYFSNTLASVTLELPMVGPNQELGASMFEQVALNGPTKVQVIIPPSGQATDTDWNGLEQVPSEMVQLDLWGVSRSFGLVHLSLDPSRPSLGQIEETANYTSGILDIPPFALQGSAKSFFDVFFRIETAGKTLYGAQPARMRAEILHKPPGFGEIYSYPLTGPQRIALLTPAGEPTGLFLIHAVHVPRPTPLSVTILNPRQFEIKWPLPSPGYVLETCRALGPNAQWIPVTGTYPIEGDYYVVRPAFTGEAAFFRLSKPLLLQ